jgi:hypothetical protein
MFWIAVKILGYTVVDVARYMRVTNSGVTWAAATGEKA